MLLTCRTKRAQPDQLSYCCAPSFFPQLRAALQQPDGSLPGFMSVEEGVLRGDAARPGRARFGGMVLGELKGRPGCPTSRSGLLRAECSRASYLTGSYAWDAACILAGVALLTAAPPTLLRAQAGRCTSASTAQSSTTSTTCERCCSRQAQLSSCLSADVPSGQPVILMRHLTRRPVAGTPFWRDSMHTGDHCHRCRRCSRRWTAPRGLWVSTMPTWACATYWSTTLGERMISS
jgi:hypothetical protein